MGKSRLCEEFARSTTARGITVRRTTGVSHGREVPLLPILGLLRDYFSITDEDDPGQAREKIARRLFDLDPALEETLPLLYDFLEVPDPGGPPAQLTPEVRMRRIFEALHRMTQQRSDREVLVLVVEDLQWFDPQSEIFLERVVESFPGSKTLVVANFRPEFSAGWMRHSYYRQLPLAPLPGKAVGEMLGGLLGVDLSLAPLVGFLQERTGGKLLPGKGAEARPLLEAALAGFERLGLPDGVGWCHDHLGWAGVVDGEYDRARDHFERAVEVARSDPLGEWLEPHALAALAPLVALSGDGERALRLAEEAVEAARRLPARPVLAMALTRAGETAVLAGQPRRAAGILVELLGVLADLGTQQWVADALETAALVLEAEDNAEQPSVIFGASDRLRESAGEPRGGVRVIAEEVRHAWNRLASALGAERFALHEARGRALPREAAITLALAGLTARGHDVGHF